MSEKFSGRTHFRDFRVLLRYHEPLHVSLPITSDIHFVGELIPNTNNRSNVAMCLCKHTDLDSLSENVICNTLEI